MPRPHCWVQGPWFCSLLGQHEGVLSLVQTKAVTTPRSAHTLQGHWSSCTDHQLVIMSESRKNLQAMEHIVILLEILAAASQHAGSAQQIRCNTH